MLTKHPHSLHYIYALFNQVDSLASSSIECSEQKRQLNEQLLILTNWLERWLSHRDNSDQHLFDDVINQATRLMVLELTAVLDRVREVSQELPSFVDFVKRKLSEERGTVYDADTELGLDVMESLVPAMIMSGVEKGNTLQGLINLIDQHAISEILTSRHKFINETHKSSIARVLTGYSKSTKAQVTQLLKSGETPQLRVNLDFCRNLMRGYASLYWESAHARTANNTY